MGKYAKKPKIQTVYINLSDYHLILTKSKVNLEKTSPYLLSLGTDDNK